MRGSDHTHPRPILRAEIGAEGTASAAKPQFRFVVPMHTDGADATTAPFFLVAGMFGNVLNLRHLANLVGRDRRFYAIQAQGLRGDEQPHETFEEMAPRIEEQVEEVDGRQRIVECAVARFVVETESRGKTAEATVGDLVANESTRECDCVDHGARQRRAAVAFAGGS